MEQATILLIDDELRVRGSLEVVLAADFHEDEPGRNRLDNERGGRDRGVAEKIPVAQSWTHAGAPGRPASTDHSITRSARRSGADRIARPTAVAVSSPSPSPRDWLLVSILAEEQLRISSHQARPRATSARLARSPTHRAAHAWPRSSGRGATPPRRREFSMCPQSLAGLAYRIAGGVVLPPNPVASSRLTDECASQHPTRVQPLLSGVHA